MKGAHFVLDPAFRVGPVSRRLFGTFVEHMGRSVYTGIYEPTHSTADAYGFRSDVLALVGELGASVVRYPGGNFVSGYRWEDGVGPRVSRPRRLDLAWRSIEANEVGLNEFLPWARRAGLEPMIVVNLGTRGLQEACDLLEYANHPGGTFWSDLRRSHGLAEPHGIRVWCLGNEMDGTWQVGHKTGEEYGRLAAETARAMRLVDPSIELVAAGSSNTSMATFGAWEATVLEHVYEDVDYISLHAYYEELDDDLASFLASAVDMDRFIGAVAATADHVGARLRSCKRLKLSFDEWNVWYQASFKGRRNSPWEVAPRLIEDNFSVADAVVVGDLLITLLRHADRIGIACMAQLVNVIAPIRTEPDGVAWRQTIFHPFAITSRLAHGTVLVVEPECPTYATARYGEVPVLDATAVYDEASGDVVIFAVNRDQSRALPLLVELRGFPELSVVDVWVMSDPDLNATNTPAAPERVTPTRGRAVIVEGRLTVVLPPVSWSALRLGVPEPIRPTTHKEEGQLAVAT